MNCVQFESRLNLLLDQRRSPADDPALAAHALDCADCEQLLNDHAVLVACVAQIESPLPNRGFALRVVAAAAPTIVAPRHDNKNWTSLGIALSSAAALMLVFSVVWRSRYARPVGGEQIATRKGLTEVDLLLEAPRLGSRWRDYRESLDEFTLALPGSAVLGLDEMERIAPGIRPLRESLALIWDTLRRTLPTGREAKSPPAENRAHQMWLPLVA